MEVPSLDSYNHKYTTTVRTLASSSKTYSTNNVKPNVAGANNVTLLVQWTRGVATYAYVKVQKSLDNSTYYPITHNDQSSTGIATVKEKVWKLVAPATYAAISIDNINAEWIQVLSKVSGANVTGAKLGIKAIIDRT